MSAKARRAATAAAVPFRQLSDALRGARGVPVCSGYDSVALPGQVMASGPLQIEFRGADFGIDAEQRDRDCFEDSRDRAGVQTVVLACARDV